MITDVNRGMVVVNSMADVAGVIRCVTSMALDNHIVVVRAKDRFEHAPAAGGWRDILLNFYVPTAPPPPVTPPDGGEGEGNAQGGGGGEGNATAAPGLRHVGELQIAHAQLVNARAGLPGHLIYSRVRNSVEIVTLAFLSKAVAKDVLAALHKCATPLYISRYLFFFGRRLLYFSTPTLMFSS
jgi:hypothetical protein